MLDALSLTCTHLLPLSLFDPTFGRRRRVDLIAEEGGGDVAPQSPTLPIVLLGNGFAFLSHVRLNLHVREQELLAVGGTRVDDAVPLRREWS